MESIRPSKGKGKSPGGNHAKTTPRPCKNPKCGKGTRAKSGYCRQCQGKGPIRSVDIPQNLADRVRNLAITQHRTYREQINHMLEQYLRKEVIE